MFVLFYSFFLLHTFFLSSECVHKGRGNLKWIHVHKLILRRIYKFSRTLVYHRKIFSCSNVCRNLIQSSCSLFKQALSDKANWEPSQCHVFNKVVQFFINRAVSTSHRITVSNESCEAVNTHCQVYLHVWCKQQQFKELLPSSGALHRTLNYDKFLGYLTII